ncbi:MAG: hypothetical protein ACLFRG_19100 [Desulfococcaceae bacterium]
MRRQANTVKILENNPALMRLRELDAPEKIAAHGSLKVVLGEGGLSDKIVNRSRPMASAFGAFDRLVSEKIFLKTFLLFQPMARRNGKLWMFFRSARFLHLRFVLVF